MHIKTKQLFAVGVACMAFFSTCFGANGDHKVMIGGIPYIVTGTAVTAAFDLGTENYRAAKRSKLLVIDLARESSPKDSSPRPEISSWRFVFDSRKDALGKMVLDTGPGFLDTPFKRAVVLDVVAFQFSQNRQLKGTHTYKIIVPINVAATDVQIFDGSRMLMVVKFDAADKKEPNKALVPTVTSVTPAADAPVAPAAPAAHL